MTTDLIDLVASPAPGRPKSGAGERAGFGISTRLATSIARVVNSLEPAVIEQLAALDDDAALAVIALSALRKNPLPADARARLALRGAQRFNSLVAGAGGVYTTAEVMALLGKTEGAVQKMVARRQLIAFKRDGAWAYPTAQFDSNARQPLAGLQQVLRAFPDDVDADTVALFFLSGYEATGKTPLQLLAQGFKREALALSAAAIRDHGAR